MRKRYSKEDLEDIERQAKLGISCEMIGHTYGVSASSIQHVLSRRGIKFCRKPITPIPDEVWKDCIGIPDIQVSNMGRFVRKSSQSLIDGYVTTGGYLTVDFSGIGTFSSHRLVAMNFIPNPENKPEVNHRNGVKTDNSVFNLEWVTPSENMRHALDTGLKRPKSGQEHHRTALTEQQVAECVVKREEGVTYPEIAKDYDVYWKTVSRHVNNYRRNTERSETIP